MLYRDSRITIKYLQELWKKTTQLIPLTYREKSFFIILCFCEIIYKAGFKLVNWFKRHKKPYLVSWAKVIAVGNLSVGGTGKSVFASFLIKALSGKQGAIVLRGYKGSLIQTNKSFLVSDGNLLFCPVDACGDEAYMMATALSVPVVVGKRRDVSCQILEQLFRNTKNIDYFIFDDSYQNHQVKKDCEILLLDARHPFENDHCLPAGRLREKDYTRADIIVLTHADRVDQEKLSDIKTRLLSDFNQKSIFSGKHAWQALLSFNQGKDQTELLKNKLVMVCAGIGSFDNFKQAVEREGIIVAQTRQLPDHHAYTEQDLNFLLQQVLSNSLVGIVTTLKDWWKIKPFLELGPYKKLPVYVVSIEFEFLLEQEYHGFMKQLSQKLDFKIN